jgi:tetratricopeptide (TPR) repeat protein
VKKTLCLLTLLWAALPVGRVALGQGNPGVAWYLTGRVILEDGLPSAERVDIVITCNGQPYVAAQTDKAGLFSFRLGAQGNRSLQDASVGSADGSFGRPAIAAGPPPTSNGSTSMDPQQTAATDTATQPGAPIPSLPRNTGGERAFMRCDMQAQLPGYRSESSTLANRRPMDNPDLGTIVLHPLRRADGPLVTVTALAAPRDARKAFESGRQALKGKRPEDARKAFEKATRLYPRYAAAWCELGKLQIDARQLDDACRLFETSIHADPKFLDPYLQLAALQAVAQQWPQLAATTGAALHLDARDYPQAYYLNALANFNIGNADAAEKSAWEAERLDPRRLFPGSWQVLGRVLALRREFAEALAQMREYLRLAPHAPDAPSVRARMAEIEKLSAAGAAPN